MIMTLVVLSIMMVLSYGMAQRDYSKTSGQKGAQGTTNRFQGHRPPPHPVMTALDANRDHVIDAAEIANAPKALLKLDTNGDGTLSHDELRPKRPASGVRRSNQRSK